MLSIRGFLKKSERKGDGNSKSLGQSGKQRMYVYMVDFALQFAPPGPEEQAIRAKLAKIGIGAGKTFDFKDLSLKPKLEVGLGMKAGERKIDKAVAKFGKKINGRHIGAAQGDRAYYHGNWMLRAIAAKPGIHGNDADEATYPFTKWEANG